MGPFELVVDHIPQEVLEVVVRVEDNPNIRSIISTIIMIIMLTPGGGPD